MLPLSRESLLHSAFVARARARPEAIALVSRSERWTYGQLLASSRALAKVLLQSGLAPGERVALCVDRSPRAVASALAVLMAGAAYVPFDPQSPPARRRRMLEDCQVSATIATPHERDRLGGGSFEGPLGRLVVDPTDPVYGAREYVSENEPLPLPGVDPTSPAYVLYTSGSSGSPKGITISHRGAMSFVSWAQRTFGINAEDRLANVTELSFDLSVLDFFAALSSGAQVHLVSREDVLRPRRLVEALAREGITLWYSVPSVLTLLLEQGGLGQCPPRSLSRVLYAGEAFPIRPLRQLMSALPWARFCNLFGPTETNVCTYHTLPNPLAPNEAVIPIGFPCDHLRVELLDGAGRPVRGDEPGELCVAGPAVMSGYLGQPELTAQAMWPAGTLAGLGPLYRTGDFARRDSSGCLWFAGRRDRLLKHRGYRIELGEIEAALAAHPGLREVAVTLHRRDSGEMALRAVVVPEPGVSISVLDVKTHCGRTLPPYMVPSVVEIRDSLPRTLTGKIDLRRV